jgi:archaellum component FlaF (FlaF/FlaG flagellin family)
MKYKTTLLIKKHQESKGKKSPAFINKKLTRLKNLSITITFLILIILLTNLIISEDISGGNPLDDSIGDSVSDISGSTGDETTETTKDLSSINFNLDQPKTWFKNWNQIKSQLKASTDDINSKWAKASEKDKNNCMNNLINQENKNIKISNLGSSELSLDKNGRLTNGKTYLDPEKLPSGVKSIEYNEEKKAFVYKFDNHQLIIRKGILNNDLTITGTGWPSEGLKWNGEGEFHQTETGVTLKGDSKINVGIMEVSRAKNNADATVKFKAGDNGNKYVRGTNLHVLVKDFARIITPTNKETEVFIGTTPHDLQNQYVMLNPAGDEIKIIGEEITAEVLKDLKNVEVDGEKVTIKNKEIFFEFKKDADGKDRIYTNAPEKGYAGKYKNLRDPNGDVIVTTETTDEVTVDTTSDPSKNDPPKQDSKDSKGTESSISSDNGRVKYTWNKKNKLKNIPIDIEGKRVMDTQFTLSDQDTTKYTPATLPDTSPRRVDLIARLNLGAVAVLWKGRGNLPGGGKYITRDELIEGFTEGASGNTAKVLKSIASQAFPSNKQYFIPGETISIYSGGKGSGTATIQVWEVINGQYKKGKTTQLTGSEAELIIGFVNNKYNKNKHRF